MPRERLKIEKRILAYLFSDKKYIAYSISKINQDSLSSPIKPIYQILFEYYNKHRDIITDDVVQLKFTTKNLSEDILVKYNSLIMEVKNIPVKNEGEFNYLIDELNNFNKRNKLSEIIEHLGNKNPAACSNVELEEMQLYVKKQISTLNVNDLEIKKEGTIKDSAKNRWKRYSDIKNNPQLLKFVKTGFKKIDDVEGGFLPGELIYVIGRKGDGKSIALLHMATAAWLSGESVLLVSLEISKEDYERRFDSKVCQIPSNNLKRGILEPEDEKVYRKYLKNIDSGLGPNEEKTGTFYIIDCPSGCTASFIDAKIEDIQAELGIKFSVVVIDYAGIMNPEVPDIKRLEQAKISLDLKRIARTRECVILTAAQMNRKGKEDIKNKTADVESSSIAESDAIGDNIDWGISISTTSEERGLIKSFKTRDAAPFEIRFNKKYSHMTIEELDDFGSNWGPINGLEE